MGYWTAERAAIWATALSIGTCLGLLISPSTVSLEWETLATGGLAVGAAGWSVRAILRTDKDQERRHQTLLWRNDRRDRVLAIRAAVPGAERIRGEAEELMLAASVVKQIKTTVENAEIHYRTMHRKLKQFRSAFTDPIEQASELFPGDMLQRYRNLENNLAAVIESELPPTGVEALLYGDSMPDIFTAELIGEFSDLVGTVRELAADGMLFADNLDRLWTDYSAVNDPPMVRIRSQHR